MKTRFSFKIILCLLFLLTPRANATCGDDAQAAVNGFNSCMASTAAYLAANPDPCNQILGSAYLYYSGGYLYMASTFSFPSLCGGGISYGFCNSLVSGPTCNNDIVIPASQQPTQSIPKPVNVCGSIIQVDNQILGEVVPIVGSHFSMTYFSNRETGRSGDYTIHLPLTGTSLVTGLSSVDVTVKNGSGSSTLYSNTFATTSTGLYYDYVWNGLDSMSNPTLGANSFKEFVTQNWSAAGSYGAFVIGPTEADFNLGNFKAKLIGLGGWVPSIYHFYDTVAQKIYKGDGTVRSVVATSVSGGGYMVAEEDASLAYFFDSSGKHTLTKTGLIGTTIYTFNYDGSGRLSSIDEPFSQTTTFHRDMSGNLTSIESPKGQSTAVTLDANGYIHTFTNPNGEVYTMTYVNSGGLLYTFEKPNGLVSTFTYDSYGNLTLDSHSSGYSQALAPSANPNDIGKTSTLGRVTEYVTTPPIDGITTYRYTTYPDTRTESYTDGEYGSYATVSDYVNGNSSIITRTSDPRYGAMATYLSQAIINSRETDTTLSVTQSTPTDPFSVTASTKVDTTGNLVVTTTYNGSTKVFSSATSIGRTSAVGIDSYERVISAQRGSLYAVGYTYSSEKLTDITQNTRDTHFSYNTDGTVLSVTDPLSKTTAFGYDGAGRVNLVTLPDSRYISYTYDADGNLASVTPPSSSAHNLTFNSEDLFENYDQPILGMNPQTSLIYTYDDDNALTEIDKPNGDSIIFTYDPTSGVLQNVAGPSGTYYYYFYAGNSLPSSIYSPGYIWGSSISYSGTTPIGVSTSGPDAGSYFSYAKTLQTNGLVSDDTVTASSGSSQITYTYDYDEYPYTAGDVTLTYDTPNGLLSGTIIGSSPHDVTDAYTYNSYGEVTGYGVTINGTSVYSLTLGRDGAGRVYTKSENLNGTTKNYGYGFDDDGRLHTTTLGGSTVATYNYSNNSNRTSGTIYGTSLSATYNAQDSLTAYNVYDYAYNLNGDLTSRTNTLTSAITSYTYDEYGNLTEVTLPSTTVIDYEIDPLNRRVGKKVGGTVQKRWVYQDQTRIAAELDASGNVTKRFIYGSKSNIPDYMIDVVNSENYRIISDQIGSPRLVIKVSNGAITQKMEHDEFGNVLQDTNPGFTPFGFAGGLYDADTGLVRFGARDFDPSVGRWTSKDPLLFKAGDTNLYGYVMNDPVNLKDPSGKDPNDFGGYSNGFEYLPGSYANQIGGEVSGAGTALGAAAAILPALASLPITGQYAALACITNPAACSEIGLAAAGAIASGLSGTTFPPDPSSNLGIGFINVVGSNIVGAVKNVCGGN